MYKYSIVYVKLSSYLCFYIVQHGIVYNWAVYYNYLILLPIVNVINCYTLLYIVIHCYTLLYIVIHCYTLLYIVIHCYTLYNVIHCYTTVENVPIYYLFVLSMVLSNCLQMFTLYILYKFALFHIVLYFLPVNLVFCKKYLARHICFYIY